jgi:hypothetical protein
VRVFEVGEAVIQRVGNARKQKGWRVKRKTLWGPGLLSFSRHGNESVEVECIPKHGDGHVDNVA